MSKKLHYDKEALIKEYKKTFVVMTIATAVVVAFAVIFFFVMAAYLGEHGPYFDTFEKDGRIEGSYDGLKLKSHEVVNPEVNEEYYNKKPHVKGTITH
jgi:hypothetical protein